MSTTTRPVALVILDEFGFSRNSHANAIAQAAMPTFHYLTTHYQARLLHASGEHVGLLPGTVGNSEVGHRTIGAGRVIPSTILRMRQAIDDQSLAHHPILQQAYQHCITHNRPLHLMGLLSDGAVHSYHHHLHAFIQHAHAAGVKEMFVHAFLDGRDCPARSAPTYLTQLENVLAYYPGARLASIHGRWYAMDRDQNWERTEQCYDVLVGKKRAPAATSWQAVLEQQYTQGVTDEFVPPTPLLPDAFITEGDGVIFYNTRPDRARQLTALFVDRQRNPDAPHLSCFITPVRFGLVPVQGDKHWDHQTNNDGTTPYLALFDVQQITNTLLDHIAQLPTPHNGVFIIAETEKYAHVTSFFNGGREEPLPNETWVLVPSLKIKNYVHHPEMSAATITDRVLQSLTTSPASFYLINYANADMVGHSGDLPATIKACEFLDHQLTQLYKSIVQERGGTLIITADHGKAEAMLDEATGQPRTAHTTSPVPLIVISQKHAYPRSRPFKEEPIDGLKCIMSIVLEILQEK